MDFDDFVQRFPIPDDFDERVAAIIGPTMAVEALPHLNMAARVYLAKCTAKASMTKQERKAFRRAMLIAMNQPGGRLPDWDPERSLDTFDFDFNKKMNRAHLRARHRALHRPA